MIETTQLLARWRDGDDAALGDLLARSLPFLRERVRELLGPALRGRMTSDDVVQDAVVDFLRNGPRFVPANGRQLERLLSRVVANTICDHGKWFAAARRSMARESTLETGPLEVGHRSAASSNGDPAVAAERAELRDRLRLALELLPERDRQLILWRDWEKRPYADIGAALGIGEEAARTAWRRATDQLTDAIARLRRGELDWLLDESGS